MSFRSRRLWVFGIILLAVITALFYLGRTIIRDTVIIPIAYLIWVIQILLSVVPQLYFWIVTLVIALVIAYRSFSGTRIRREPVPKVQDIGAPTGRVEYWAARTGLVRMGQYYQSTFNEALGRLALDLLAYRNRLTNRQIDKGLNNGTLRVPADVRDFLLNNVLKREFERQGVFTYLYRSIRLMFLEHMKLSQLRRTDLAPQAQSIIQYMEEELEVHYGNPGQ